MAASIFLGILGSMRNNLPGGSPRARDGVNADRVNECKEPRGGIVLQETRKPSLYTRLENGCT